MLVRHRPGVGAPWRAGDVSSGMDSPWRLVHVAEIEPVQPAADARARGWIRDLAARLRGESQAPVDHTPSRERLGPLDAARLARLVPPPPLAAQRAALDALHGRSERAIVLRPDDGGWDAVLDGRSDVDVERLLPPDALPPGSGLPNLTRERLADPTPLHAVRVERWGVRHHDGLAALRELLALLADRTGPWSADLGPWAWAWIRNVLPEARGLPSPVAPASLDGEALQDWLGHHDTLRLRGRGGEPDARTYSALAKRARGEAGVAAAVWRTCLWDGAERPPADEAEAEDDEAGEAAAGVADDDGQEDADEGEKGTVWVRHPSDLELPGLVTVTRYDLLLLHAVLAHGRPPVQTVARAVDRGIAETEVALSTLIRKELLARDDDGRVRPVALALPAIRARLESEAFVGVVP